MKRLFVVAAFLIIAMSVSCSNVLFAAEKSNFAKVMDLTGDVQVMKIGTSAWIPAKVWMQLDVGDIIKTGPGASADLGFGDLGRDALVRVDPNSSMKVESYDQVKGASKGKIMLDLAVGDIMVKIDKIKDESQFQVRTPTSIVGVRGTGFKVHVSPKE